MSRLLASREKVFATVLILIFFLLNVSIASRSPHGGWMDEVSYADPGLNLATGKGWNSTAYPYETDRQFFSGTPPLYAVSVAAWVKLFGVSMVSTRIHCYFLAAIGMFFLWLGTYRFGLLTPAFRLFWIVFLSTEYSMNWMERNQRYDVWIFLGLSLAWYGASLRSPWTRFPLIFLGCFLVPLAGLIGVPYVFLLGAMVIVLSRFRFWKEVGVAMMGAVTGLIALGTFFWFFDCLDQFRHSVNETTVLSQSRPTNLLAILYYPHEDPSAGVMIGLLVLLTFYHARIWRVRAVWLALGWGITILLPCMMIARGTFAMMYFYMLIIPLSLALLQLTLTVRPDHGGRYLRVLILGAMGFLCLGGLPARLYTSYEYWEYRDPRHFHEFVRTYIQPEDRVYAEFPFYFELRDYAKFTATPFYLQIMPLDEAQPINVAIVQERDGEPDLTLDASRLIHIGGGWKKVAVFPTPEMAVGLKDPKSQSTFILYRRDVP